MATGSSACSRHGTMPRSIERGAQAGDHPQAVGDHGRVPAAGAIRGIAVGMRGGRARPYGTRGAAVPAGRVPAACPGRGRSRKRSRRMSAADCRDPRSEKAPGKTPRCAGCLQGVVRQGPVMRAPRVLACRRPRCPVGTYLMNSPHHQTQQRHAECNAGTRQRSVKRCVCT